MAINNRNDPELLKRLVARELGIEPSRIRNARQVEFGLEWEFAIDAIPAPRRVMAAVAAAAKILNDPFRREVVKAAVPDVFAALTELVEQAESTFTNQTVRLDERVIDGLLSYPYDNRQANSRHHRPDRPRLAQPSGQADHDPFAPLPKIHP